MTAKIHKLGADRAKTPAYSPREMSALRAADRVVVRLWFNDRWAEEEFVPFEDERVVDCLTRIERSLSTVRHFKKAARIMLYVGSMVNGKRQLASVRRR